MDCTYRTLELLAPARTPAEARQAIMFGADAVYIGGPAFGARSSAGNSIESLKEVISLAHPFGVKVYVTLNTIIYEDELTDVRQLIHTLYEIGVDALIVQDVALLEMDIPPIDLHASTQTDARSPQKAAMLSAAGFSQIVLPREASLDEIRAYAQACPEAKLEVFVHGALCVSYSGDCHAGAALTGRSANRGECPQICRLKYTLQDESGNKIVTPDGKDASRYWLSLADMNRIDFLGDLADAGATSFKIEGRLKDANYVLNVTRAYSEALDKVIVASGGKYRRSSYGRVITNYVPDLNATFNRGYTPYFINESSRIGITSWNTPKWVGQPVGKVTKVGKGFIEIDNAGVINNGDGITYFGNDGELAGLRINRAEGNRLYPAPGSQLPFKLVTKLYRNATARSTELIGEARRVIDTDMELGRMDDGRISLTVRDVRGLEARIVSDKAYTDIPKSSPLAHRRDTLGKLGNTIYRLNSLKDELENVFIPAKDLADMRRRVFELLDEIAFKTYTPRKRQKSVLKSDIFSGMTFDYHSNIANSLAKKFYLSHGASQVDNALEISVPKGLKRVMTTRYCIRRELGACLKSPNANLLPEDMYLVAPIGKLKLMFDCANCRMTIYTK